MMWIQQEQDMFSTDTDLIYQTQWKFLGCYRLSFIDCLQINIIWIMLWVLLNHHYSDVMMSAMESQMTSVSIVCSTVCSGEDQRKYRGSASLACEGNPLVKWIYLTNGQKYGKCFYLMTSSWSWLNGFMMTSSNANIFCVTGPLCGDFTGEFPSQRPVTGGFDVFFDLCLNKRLSKQS